MKDFLRNQNDPALINLLKASTVAYARAKKGENVITLSVVILSTLYPVAYIFYKGDESILFWLFFSSFILSIIVSVLASAFSVSTFLGAAIKEEFDTRLFSMRWKTTIKKADRLKISELADKCKQEISDWYPPNIEKQIPHSLQVALCQRCNTAWDINLRKKYVLYLYVFLSVYSIVLIYLFVVFNLNASIVLYILFSVLAMYIHLIDIVRGHIQSICNREEINKILDDIIENKKMPDDNLLRDIQDEIHATRALPAKVPDFFFKIHNKKMNSDYLSYVDKINLLYKPKN